VTYHALLNKIDLSTGANSFWKAQVLDACTIIHYAHRYTPHGMHTVLTIHCTHYTPYSLHTVLTIHCTHYTPYSLHTVLTTHRTHYTL
jgi:hypothetical protein